ncbi:MAG: hypothetical protein LBI54_04655, partial [Lachnospiraceae bacterium]|nr:hypothetical protein [Lachnospiraceae bacterium]
ERSQQGDVVVAIVPSAANLVYRDWVAEGLPDGFTAYESGEANTLRLFAAGQLAGGKATVNSATEGLFAGKKLTIKVPAAGSGASFTLSQKGKIDLLDPSSTLAVTAKFKNNTASRIAKVELYEDSSFSKKSELFEVVATDRNELRLEGNTFFVKATGPLPQGRAPQSLFVKLYFEDKPGGEPALEGKAPLVVKPAQASVKGRASRGTVTLYSGQPGGSEGLALSLTAPVNVGLGAASLAGADSPFELVRTGRDTWALGFAGGALPENPKSSYTLTLELWPQGTYKPDANGGFAEEYGSGKTAAKPATVKVKVVVKG